MDSPRDPRTDPKAGDVLSTPYRRRVVYEILRSPHGVFVHWECSNGAREYCSLTSWQAWARTAKVLETAP